VSDRDTLTPLRRDLEDAASHLGRPHELRFQPMFGGLMAYFGEKPCAWLSPAGLALKLAAADQRELLGHEGAARLVAKPGAAPSRHYILVPASIRRDTARFAHWLDCSARTAMMVRPRQLPRR
jgi:hypothetical protein